MKSTTPVANSSVLKNLQPLEIKCLSNSNIDNWPQVTLDDGLYYKR